MRPDSGRKFGTRKRVTFRARFFRVGAEFAVALRPRLCVAMVEQLRGSGATRHDSVEIRVGRDFDMFVFKATPMALKSQRLYFGGQKY